MVKRFFLYFALVGVVSAGVSNSYAMTTPAEQISYLLSTISESYGPLETKEKSFGYDWETVKSSYMSQANSCNSSIEFYQLATQVLMNLKDAHVSVQLPSTLTAALPLQIVATPNALYLGYLSEEAKSCAAQPGDRLVAIDQQSAEDVLANASAQKSIGNSVSDRMLNAFGLTKRSEARGDFGIDGLKNKQTVFSFEGKDRKTVDCAFNWKVAGLGLVDRPYQSFMLRKQASKIDNLIRSADLREYFPASESKRIDAVNKVIEKIESFASTAISYEQASFDAAPAARGSKIELGKQEPIFALPKDFKRIELPAKLGALLQDNLYAGTFERGGKTVGFLRIGSYVPSQIMFSIVGLRQIISTLEDKSDYLVIDQTFNPGGYVIYSDWVVKSLAGEYDDAKHMRFSFRPSQKSMMSIAAVQQVVDAMLADPQTADEVKNNYTIQTALKMAKEDYAKMREAYISHSTMSVPVRLYPLSMIVEEVINMTLKGAVGQLGDKFLKGVVSKTVPYTKPVFFMINGLDFSGGDATPAVLQDYGRVKMIGQNTAGAGGSVGAFSQSAGEELDFHLTQSLMIRKDNALVENIGVKPDIEVLPSQQDIREGYTNYFERVMKTIAK